MRPKTLLVDDEADFVGLLALRLEARGYAVHTAYDAESGLALVAGEAPDVVVLDVNLPDRSGLDVLREIKERWPLAQVVMLTGLSDVSTAVAGMQLGAVDYLVKPVDVDVLTQSLERAAGRGLDQAENLRMIETGKLAVLGKLAEGVAHEINNPVNIIMQKAGWAGELLEEPGFAGCPGLAEVHKELEDIVAQGRRCRAIVAKLMSFGGRIDPRPGVFGLAEVAQAVLEGFRERAQALGVALSLDIAPDLPRLAMARAELEQVLAHLVENALEAMTPDGGLLTVSAVAGQDSLEVRVADTGRGIEPELAQRVFEPFFSTKEVGQGSGLGLAICHGILRSLGGEIRVDSEPGQGATFRFTLPVQGR
jgi:two-component system, NtrC family, sensor kinase